jgi:DNA-directed RNA polymerase specialized sigma24 family protein
MSTNDEEPSIEPMPSVRRRKEPSRDDYGTAWDWLNDNIGLVIKLRQLAGIRYPFDKDELVSDLLETVALCSANFDPSRRIKFTTYAGVCVRRAMAGRRFERSQAYKCGLASIGSTACKMTRVAMPNIVEDPWPQVETEDNATMASRIIARTHYLDHREKTAVMLRNFGGYTYADLAGIFGVCGARCRQIEERGKRKAKELLKAYRVTPWPL